MKRKNSKLSFIIPAHNEEKILRKTVLSLERLITPSYQAQIIIVDDNSTDATPKITEELVNEFSNIRVIHRKDTPGVGYALVEAKDYIEGDYVFWIMADGCDEFKTISLMLSCLEDGWDLVIGSRYIKGGKREKTFSLKKFLSSKAYLLTKLFFGMRIKDVTNAFRGFKKELLNHINLERGDFSISFEFTIKSYIKGFKIKEVPTTYYERREGKSKFSILKMIPSYLSILFKILLNSECQSNS